MRVELRLSDVEAYERARAVCGDVAMADDLR
jgi:hypothetical protein